MINVLTGTHKNVDRAMMVYIIIPAIAGVMVLIGFVYLYNAVTPSGHWIAIPYILSLMFCYLSFMRMMYVLYVKPIRSRVYEQMEKEVDDYYRYIDLKEAITLKEKKTDGQ